MLKIYNTLTRNKEEFKPTSGEVKMYTCGVTVYDNCHIGHGRSLYIFEVIRRYLTYRGFKVKFVRNITDVDDKIINRAKELKNKKKISLLDAFNQIRETYIKSYYKDLQSLGIPPADFEPKATENITEIIEFIKKIIEKGYGYEREGNVYFRIRKFSSYGKLSGKNIDELFEGVRIENDPLKEYPFDFALWKRKKEDEPFWSSPFGEGRPGWHIECSVMSTKFLGPHLDIHGGGRDLIFPHHENEIAQSESVYGAPFSRFWIHHGLITVEGEKMAKSLGNFYLIRDILKNYHNEVLKLFYLSAHYRSSLDFNWQALKEAQTQRTRIYAVYDRLKGIETKEITSKEIQELEVQFQQAMDDDFNMPKAKSILFSLIRIANEVQDKNLLGQIKNLFLIIGNIFLLFQEDEEISEEFKRYIEEKLRERKALRERGCFQEADRIRKELLEKGIVVEDLRDGTSRWRIKR